MELKFSKINGTNPHLDYEDFERSVKAALEPSCKEAEVFILNRFPIAVTAQATIDFIILLNIPNVHQSWYRLSDGDNWNYIKNQIIAVSVIEDYENCKIALNGNTLETDNENLSFQDEASKIKWGLTNYLSEKCGLDRKHITINPLIWLKNSRIEMFQDNVLIGNKLTYKSIENVISKNYYFKWAGYIDWHKSDILFEQQIKNIFEQASKDSKDGFITKKKIDRIQRKFGVKQEEAHKLIGEKLVEVTGKAGTGKTAELLKWMLKNSLQKTKGVFLTYNHLLVYDIANQINSFSNRLEINIKKASTTSYTIHGYFYNVAKKLGVLLLMTEERIKELTLLLDNRWHNIEMFFNDQRKPNDTSLAWLKMRVQTFWKVDEGLKREAILFIQHIENQRYLPNKEDTIILFKKYRDNKVEKLANLESSNVYLKDYVEVLNRIRQATSDLDGFLKDLDVASKYDLLHVALDLTPKILEKDKSGRINFEKLKTR